LNQPVPQPVPFCRQPLQAGASVNDIMGGMFGEVGDLIEIQTRVVQR
jgi:hypothetical protein